MLVSTCFGLQELITAHTQRWEFRMLGCCGPEVGMEIQKHHRLRYEKIWPIGECGSVIILLRGVVQTQEKPTLPRNSCHGGDRRRSSLGKERVTPASNVRPMDWSFQNCPGPVTGMGSGPAIRSGELFPSRRAHFCPIPGLLV